MSENSYANIYRNTEWPVAFDGFDLGVMLHNTQTAALKGAVLSFDTYELVAVAVPFIMDAERAKRDVEYYQASANQGDVFE